MKKNKYNYLYSKTEHDYKVIKRIDRFHTILCKLCIWMDNIIHKVGNKCRRKKSLYLVYYVELYY